MGSRESWASVHATVLILALAWCSYALSAVSVARILGAVSSVTGGKVPVHFKVVVSEEYEKSSRLKRWMRRAPHALIVQVDCAGVATRASSFAWLESGFDSCVCAA
jgi:hypothetical protein